jgi:hypothetical protein
MPSLYVRPIELAASNAYVGMLHRHHKPVVGHRFSLCCVNEKGHIHGVASIGRPVARLTCFRSVVEVTRLCTDGTPNACSILYAAAARVAREMGYAKIQTFILDSEPGTSLRAAGWSYEAPSMGGNGWQSRAGRRNDQPACPKQRWVKILSRPGPDRLPFVDPFS